MWCGIIRTIVTEYEKTEFWNALGRLYDTSVKISEAVERLAEIAATHEKRHDRSEVTIQAILDDLQKLRKARDN